MPTIAVTIVDQTVAVTQVGEIGPTGATGPTGTVSAAGSGTAGAPGIAFASDTNTGLFLAGSDILAVATGGVERVRFNASGKAEFTGNQSLSLSTGPTLTLSRTDSFDSNPSAVMASLLFKSHFDVIDNAKIYTKGTGSGYTGNLIFATNDGTGALIDRMMITPTGSVTMTNGGATTQALTVTGGGSVQANILKAGTTGYLALGSNGATASQISAFRSDSPFTANLLLNPDGGNVGIGTTAPGAKLDIVGTTSDQIRVGTATSEHFRIGRNASTGHLDFYGSQTGYTGYTFGGVDGTRMTILPGGNVGIGTTSPTAKLHVDDGGSNIPGVYIYKTLGGAPALRLSSNFSGGSTVDIDCFVPGVNNGGFTVTLDTVARMWFLPSGGDAIFNSSITPSTDNTRNLGSGSLRWGTIFAGTGTISTSDERYKVLREGGDLSDAEYRAWSNVRAIVYQDKDSFERKGSAARLHVGYSWQSIQAAFEAEGLDAGRYGLWCEDALEAPVEKTRMVSRAVEGQTETIPVLDDDGQPVFEEVQETEEVEQPFEEVRMIDGAPVLVKGVRTVAQPVFDSVQIRDEDGELLFYTPEPVEDPETGELVEGDPVPRTAPVPRMISKAKTETVSVMEEVEETYTEMEPTGETRGALRYTQCSVIEAAWLRRELAALTARLSALEAA